MKFSELEFMPHPSTLGGIQARHDFPNGYGVSVIKSSRSYGGDAGRYEVAVMLHGHLTYDTPITDDVLGWQSEPDVDEVLAAVESLPKAVKA